jgi:DUF1365 family protein
MRSRIFNGFVEHARLTPAEHRFRTGVHFYAFDLDEVEQLDQQVKGFGWNCFAPVSVRNRDYLGEGDQSLRKKLDPWIQKIGLAEPVKRITLVTSARWWGKVFNPVSFYLLEAESGDIIGLVSEVNNTFGDRHVYAEPLQKTEGMLTAEHEKEFHVSPFNSMDGRYQFTVRRADEELYIGVDLYRDGEKVLEAWMEGVGEELTTGSLWRTALRHPLRPWLTMPRIVGQAILLRFVKKLKVFKRPEPDHAHTIVSRHEHRHL